MELAVKNIKFYIKQTKQRLITGLHNKCPHIMTLNLPIMAFVLHVTHVFRSTYYWHQWGVFAVLKSLSQTGQMKIRMLPDCLQLLESSLLNYFPIQGLYENLSSSLERRVTTDTSYFKYKIGRTYGNI